MLLGSLSPTCFILHVYPPLLIIQHKEFTQQAYMYLQTYLHDSTVFIQVHNNAASQTLLRLYIALQNYIIIPLDLPISIVTCTYSIETDLTQHRCISLVIILSKNSQCKF